MYVFFPRESICITLYVLYLFLYVHTLFIYNLLHLAVWIGSQATYLDHLYIDKFEDPTLIM